jgi:hypothetical protein
MANATERYRLHHRVGPGTERRGTRAISLTVEINVPLFTWINITLIQRTETIDGSVLFVLPRSFPKF